ncbi:ATP-grasp domain-containing protein [Micromonospora sp. CA-259024]|uniref:ATP-grasp domain-containing protein n=1 Tax=Micromonospora sp. CA-259024 TaxID=3239965 RepID=UPI003D9462D3
MAGAACPAWPPQHADDPEIPLFGTRTKARGAHPDSPNDSAPVEVDLAPVAPLIAGLGLPFVIVDLALRTDGVWRVIELGDGQVSDRPTCTVPELVAQTVSWNLPVHGNDHRCDDSTAVPDDDPARRCSRPADPKRHRGAGRGPRPAP